MAPPARSESSERLDSGLILGPACPTRLRDLLIEGHPIIAQSRFSTSSGEPAYIKAAQNLKVAAQQVQRRGYFPNLPSLLPPTKEIVRGLQDSVDIVRSRDPDGYEFENRFLVRQAPLCPALWLHVSVGSGHKIDEATWHQPVALHAAGHIARIKPALVIAAEVSRWTRAHLAMGPWFHAQLRLSRILQGPPYIWFNEDRVEELTPNVVMRIVEKAAHADAEADSMRTRTREALRANVPFEDEGGFAVYPFSQPVPPPLTTAWRSVDGRSRGQQIAVIDTPIVRNHLRDNCDIQYGLPRVVDADGEPVDQLEIVRAYGRRRGLPEWPAMRLAQSLADLGYSPDGLKRHRHSLAASYRDQDLTRSQRSRILEGLDRSLEFFRTGELWRGVGDGGDRVLATVLLPPDGDGYISDSDYSRIRAYIRVNQVEFTRAHRYTFGHHPVVVGSEPGRLLPRREAGGVSYRVRADQPGAGARRGANPLPAPAISAADFSLSLVQGLRDHAQNLTPLVAPPESGPTAQEQERRDIAGRLTANRRRLEVLANKIFPPDGEIGVQGTLLRDANRQYDDLSARIRTDDIKLDQATLQAEAAITGRPRTIAVEDLMAVLTSLRDPEDLSFQPQWRTAITDLALTPTVNTAGRNPVIETRWTGTMVLHQCDDLVLVPFTGVSTRPVRRGKTRESGLIDDLRAGIALPGGPLSSQPPALRAWLRTALGVPVGPIPVLTVRDPRLLRVGMAVLFPPLRGRSPLIVGAHVGPALAARSHAAVAERLGVDLPLVKRLVAVVGHHERLPGAQRMWRSPGDIAVADLFADLTRNSGTLSIADYSPDRWATLRHAALRCQPRDQWTFPRGRIVIAPCPWCGDTMPVLLSIREATEPVCDHCRRDRTGISWPVDPYDQYRVESSPV